MAFCGFLKQSTAQAVLLGPFLDETDGKTAETGLTLTQPDLLLSKNGGALTQVSAAATLTHDALGYYPKTLSTTDTNTLGMLTVAVHESGALPIRQDYLVVPASVWDLFHLYGLKLLGLLTYGTAQGAADSTHVQLAAAESMADDVPNGNVVAVIGGTGANQARLIPDYVGSTDTALVDPAFVTTLDNTSIYAIFATPPAPTSAVPTVDAVKFGGQTVNAAGTVTMPGTVASATNITAAAGVALSATGLDAVLKTATGAVALANAVNDKAVDMLKTYSRTNNTTATITKSTGSTGLTIATDAAYEPIKSVT